MTNRAEKILSLAASLRSWDDAHACDLNAAHFFTHSVLMRALQSDPDLTRLCEDSEELHNLAETIAADSGACAQRAA